MVTALHTHHPTVSGNASELRDHALGRLLRDTLLNDRRIDGRGVSAEVRGGVVHLGGMASSSVDNIYADLCPVPRDHPFADEIDMICNFD